MKKNHLLCGLLSLFIFSCRESSPTDTVSDNIPMTIYKNTVVEYWRCWNQNSHEELRCILANDVKRYANGKLEATNQEELIELLNNWHVAIPNLKTELNDLVIYGNKAYYRWVSEGSFGAPNSMRKIDSIHGFGVLTFDSDGKISKHESYYDSMNLFLAWGDEVPFYQPVAVD